MGKKLITIMTIALAASGLAGAQTAATTPAASPTEIAQELRMVERRWVDALRSGDVKALGEILDDTYMDTDEEGHQLDKTNFLAAVKVGDLKYTTILLSSMRIHSFVYSAVVSGKARQNGTYKGETLPVSVSFTDTFVMIDGVWKVVASHRSGPKAQ
jgi:hypothetical protein